MKIKFFTIPILGGEALEKDLNAFLSAKKILEVESKLVSSQQGAHWCFCIRYVDDVLGQDKKKVDYKLVLDEATFKRFSQLRVIRKELSDADAVPAFAVFTDEELAEMAKLEELSPASLRSIPGVGEKRVAKYAEKFIQKLAQP